MKDNVQSLSPPLRLAIAYARNDLRVAFSLLLTFDHRLADIVGRASEPMIAQMKLAWWHDAIASEPALRPKGEPTFKTLKELNMPEVEEAMVRLLEAWGRILATDVWDAKTLSAFATGRSAGIFGTYARLTGYTDDISEVGEAWALADLRLRFGETVNIDSAAHRPPMLKTRQLRPLSILAVSVDNPSGIGMIWHALMGR